MKYLLSIFVLLIFSLSVLGQAEKRVDKIVGKRIAPNLKITTMEGKTFDTKDLQGKIVVYNLWYTSCPPCREEIPLLNKIVEEYKDKDVVFLALAVDDKAKIEQYIKKNPFDYQIVPNAGQLMLFSYGDVQGDGSVDLPFPTHVLVNRQGFVELKIQGKKGVEAVREELKRQFKDANNQQTEAAVNESK
jgi:peroxiredoxin